MNVNRIIWRTTADRRRVLSHVEHVLTHKHTHTHCVCVEVWALSADREQMFLTHPSTGSSKRRRRRSGEEDKETRRRNVTLTFEVKSSFTTLSSGRFISNFCL